LIKNGKGLGVKTIKESTSQGGEFVDDFARSFEPTVTGDEILFRDGWAGLDEDGILHLAFRAEEKGKGIGSRMFDFAVREFGSKVKKIQGSWGGRGDLADNYNTFIKHYDDLGDEAVWETFTGKQAKKNGFTVIESIRVDKVWKNVEVIFAKPGG